MKIPYLKILLFALSATSSFGALTFQLRTDVDGNFTQGSWLENGSVDGAVRSNAVNLGLIDDFSEGGTLKTGPIGSSAGFANFLDGAVFSSPTSPTIISSNVQIEMSVDLGNSTATADIFSTGVNIRLNDFSGVNSFTADFRFETLDGNATSLIPQLGESLSFSPFLAGIQGSSSATNNYAITATIINPVYYTVNGGGNIVENPGLPPTGSFVPMSTLASEPSYIANPWGNTTSYSWEQTGGAQFQGVNSFDIDGGGVARITQAELADGVLQEIEAVGAEGMRFTVSRVDGANFDSSEQFFFSFTGVQSQDTVLAVPEPSTILLFVLSFGYSLTIRRRR